MITRLKDIGWLILGAAITMGGQTVSGTNALPPTPPPYTAGFYPLDQVHRGQHGIAYTVFSGTRPEPMEVEILGLLHNALGPGQDMILARLMGAKPEYTGVVAGMSGSPVYIDGKLLGALSYRIGLFSKEPIAGITPIAQMLEVAHGGPGLLAASKGTAADELPPASDSVQTDAIRPMDTPLVFSGFDQQALAFWKEHAPAALGTTAVAGIGGSSGDEKQPDPIVPGSAVSALLMRGDLEIAATCTVTYVDPKQLLACGHPITQYGPVSLPMTKAQVVATLPSPYNAFKIINTTETVGSFTEDRESAIFGRFGEQARMIPITVTIHGEATPHTLHMEVVDQPQITPSVIMVAVFQGLMQRNNFTAETSYRVQSTVDISGYPQVRFTGLAAPGDLPANLTAALMVGEHFSRIYDNAARQAPIHSVNVEVEAIPRRLTAQLESAQSAATMVHAGQTIMINAAIRPWHGEIKNIRIPVTLPAVLPEGNVRLLVSDGSTLDRLTQSPSRFLNSQPLDVAATIEQLNSEHENDHLYVTLLDPSPQAVVDGRTLTILPVSMANVLEPMRQNQKLTLNGESAVPLASVPIESVLNGQQVLTLKVE
ncbi:MAG: SpoIVB peptidase S55 [Acidobacterium ailaaui]|nr:SpoIVB peptidase S55 [Pseudacidobacterium ailaaui]MDI3253683.1 SpoIVB peptidase S55 domain-containing protein [Bacillota bacterium]